MFITRKVSGNANQITMGNEQQDKQAQMSLRMMDLVMPLMTLFITFGFSSMMGIYWIFQSVFAIIQTVILAKVMPIPRFTEEEIKAIRKAQKAQEKAQKNIIKTQPKYKSLHYIDEDDYEELPEMKQNKAANQTKNFSSQDKPEIKD
jgi:membrane protein insertase Oxa1/YidC/SpoIIIJ